MPNPGNLDAGQLPGDSDERLYFALNLKEGLTPVGVIEDWGDFEGDYPQSALNQADGQASVRDEDGMGYSSAEEVQAYYASLQQNDITILGGNNERDNRD